MIRCAYLVGPPPGAADVSRDFIGGLPNLLRQALSLQDAGIDVLTLIGVSGTTLRSDPRVRLTVIEGLGGEGHEDDNNRTRTAPAAVGAAHEGNALVARAGCVWHPKVVRRLARQPVAASEVVAAGSTGGAVYLCGSDRIVDVVTALGRRTTDPLENEGAVPLSDGEFVILPRTEAERRTAVTLLLRSLEKQADGFVSRRLHRPLSRAVTRRLLAWPITPNAMTLIAAVFGAAGVFVALGGSYRDVLIGAVLFEIQNILDGCDGEIARLKYLRSTAGEWLDQVLDDSLNIAFLWAVGVALSGGSADHWASWVARAAVVAQVVHVIGLYSGLILRAGGRGSVAALRWWVGGTATDRTGRFVGDLTRRDFYSLLYVVSAALNVSALAFFWHALITIGAAVVSTIQWIVWNGPEFQAEAEGVAGRAEDTAV